MDTMGAGIPFRGKDYTLENGFYPNKRTALVLECASDPTDRIIVTRNLPDVRLDHDEIAIQNHGPNFGVLDCLVKQGLIGEPVIDEVLDGNNLIPIVKMTPKLKSYLGVK